MIMKKEKNRHEEKENSKTLHKTTDRISRN